MTAPPPPKTVLVLGASRYQLEAIHAARRLGYRVVTTDNVPANPGHALADRSYAVDTVDRERVLEIAAREQVAGVIAVATDVGVPTVAYVTERLGLPGPPHAAARALCDKLRMRALLRGYGLPAPEWHLVTAGCRPAANQLSGRCWVLKPDRSSGAKGVRIIEDPDELDESLPGALAFSPSGAAILEHFISGHQGTCEGVIEDGEIVLAFFLDRQTARPPFVTTSGHRVPTRLSASLQLELLRQLTVLWRGLGVRQGPFDCDFVATEREVFLLDISPRVGGNSIARLLRRSAGFDIVEYAVRRACGDPYALPQTVEVRPAAIVIFGVDRAGVLAYDERAAEALAAEPWVAHLELDVPPGAAVQPFVNSRHRLGEALAVADSRFGADARATELERRLNVRVSVP